MPLHFVSQWLGAFAFTQLVECPLYLWAQRGEARSPGMRLGAAFGASLATHPLVWFVVPAVCYAVVPPGSAAAYPFMVAVAESFAVVVEAVYLHALAVRHPWRWSLAANALSATLGFASRALFGWP